MCGAWPHAFAWDGSISLGRHSATVTITVIAQAHAMDFYAMSDAERRRWLDDGLHLTEMGYDVLGRHIARAIERLAAGLKSD